MGGERAYLSIVEWPGGWSAERCVEALVVASGMDPGQAKLAVARGVPQVVGLCDEAVREEIVGAFHELGVLAIAPTAPELAAWGAPVRAKRVFVFPDRSAIGVEPWRGEHTVVRAEDVRLIVRAEARESETVVRTEAGPSGLRLHLGLGGVWVTPDMGNERVVREVRTSVRPMLDLVSVRDGRAAWVRVDPEKFSFDVLGEGRGITDRDNMAKLGRLIASVCPGATVDESFGSFVVPAGVSIGVSAKTARIDFYVLWLMTLYRSLGAL